MSRRLDTSQLTQAERQRGNPHSSDQAEEQWVPIMPVPDNAPEPGELQQAAGAWPYRDAQGRVLGYDVRFEYGNRKKQVFPLTFCTGPDGQQEWRRKGFLKPRPLYGLDALAASPDATVLVVEGCKTAEAARSLFPELAAISSPNGAGSAQHADWSPLEGRTVVIWPDHDHDGTRYAETVTRLAAEAGARLVSVVRVPEHWPEKWDLADTLPDCVTEAELHRMVEVSLGDPVDGAPLAILEAIPKGRKEGTLDRAMEVFQPAAGRLNDLQREALRIEAKELARAKLGRGSAKLIDEALKDAAAQHHSAVVQGAPPSVGGLPYTVVDSCLCRVRSRRTTHGDEFYDERLCNFEAHIREEVSRDDGVSRTLSFVIDGRTKDQALQHIEVPTGKFLAMSWVTEQWGSRAIVFAGQANKEHVRAAIQLLSAGATQRVIYEHLGWRKIDGSWVYLHAGGTVGHEGAVTGVHVDVGGRLSQYLLPAPPTGDRRRTAVTAALSLIEIAPDEVMVPLLAAVFRSVLSEVLPVDFSLCVVGPTGTFKSTLAALMQCFWGPDFTTKNLPGSWSSTVNSLELLLFAAKDAMLVVDDLAPNGSRADVDKLHGQAERLLRGAGNRSGRQRLTSECKLRPEYYPRSLILSTGEDLPHGQSLRARTVVVEVEPGTIDRDRLTTAQQQAATGMLAESMSGFLMWLSGRLDELRSIAGTETTTLRDSLSSQGQHLRTPEAIANLLWGFRMLLEYAIDTSAISRSAAEGLQERARVASLHSTRDRPRRAGSEERGGDSRAEESERDRAPLRAPERVSRCDGEAQPHAQRHRRVATGPRRPEQVLPGASSR